MTGSVDHDVVAYCRGLTDAQLEEVLRKEFARHNHGDYISVLVASGERGWAVVDGERQQ